MRKALNRILNKYGLHLFKIKDTKQPELGNSSELKILSDKDQARLKGEFGGGLKEILIMLPLQKREFIVWFLPCILKKL